MLKKFIQLIILILVTSSCTTNQVEETQSNAETEAKTQQRIKEAEAVLKRLLIAMDCNDEDVVRSCITTADGAEILWQGTKADAQERERIESAYSKLSITPLKHGEKVRFNNGKIFVFDAKKTGKNRILAWINVGKMRWSMPLWIIYTPNGWKIPPGAFIAARRLKKKNPTP